MRVTPFLSLPILLGVVLADGGRTAAEAAADGNRLLAQGAYGDAARAYSEAIGEWQCGRGSGGVGVTRRVVWCAESRIRGIRGIVAVPPSCDGPDTPPLLPSRSDHAIANGADSDPSSYVNYYKRATAYLSSGRHAAALDDFDAILKLNPAFSQVRREQNEN